MSQGKCRATGSTESTARAYEGPGVCTHRACRDLGLESGAEAITGFSPTEALHQSFPALTDARGPLGKLVDAEYCERAIRDGGVSSFDLELKTASGSLIWLNVSVLVFEPLQFSPPVAAAPRVRHLPRRLIRDPAADVRIRHPHGVGGAASRRACRSTATRTASG